MDLISLLKIASLRTGGKVLIVLLLTGLTLLAAILLKAGGVWIGAQGTEGGALQAAAALLAAVLPLLLLALVYASTESSSTSLVRRTDRVLDQLLPERLAHICPPAAAGRGDVVKVECEHARGTTMAVYRLSWRDLQLCIRVELIVRRANVGFFIPAERLDARLGTEAPGLDEVKSLWRHTLAGAGAAGNAPDRESNTGIYLFEREIGAAGLVYGRPQYALVGSVNLPEDFLWNPAAQFYFAEDLMYGARAFVLEQAALFQNA